MVFWKAIDTSVEQKQDAIFARVRQASTFLKNIDVIDFAKAVPYARITSPGVDITYAATRSPSFGESMFSERADASIESITVKNVNPMGWMLYRSADITIKVHRPNVLEDLKHPINRLLQPGNKFLIQYGWVGGSNPIIGGAAVIQNIITDDAEKKGQKEFQDELNATAATEYKTFTSVYTSTQCFKFYVTNFNLSVNEAGETTLSITAFEDAESHIREQEIIEIPKMSEIEKAIKDKKDDLVKELEAKRQNAALELMGNITRALDTKKEIRIRKVETIKDGKKVIEDKSGTYYKLGDVLDIMVGAKLKKALNASGYGNVELLFGNFNRFAPRVLDKYAADTSLWANKNISEFLIAETDVNTMLGNIAKTGGQLTVYNVINNVLALTKGVFKTNTEDGKLDLEVKAPDLQIYSRADNGHIIDTYAKATTEDGTVVKEISTSNSHFILQICDRKRYTTFMSDKNLDTMTNAEIHNIAVSNSVPTFRIGEKRSPIKEFSADIVNDDQIKSIFMKRVMPSNTRSDVLSEKSSIQPPTLLSLYRSAININMTVIGNFVMNVLTPVWVDLLIPRLNGLFYVLEKIDKIDSNGFYSTVRLISDGIDPARTALSTKSETTSTS